MTAPALKVKTTALILAAGQGTRMKSALPKVLHPVCGRPLVGYPVQAAFDAGCDEVVVVVGHGRELVEAYLAKAFGTRVRTALQVEQKGTGDAAKAGLSAIPEGTERVLVFYGDVPLLSGEDVRAVAEKLDADPLAGLSLATCSIENPQGYGRVLRDPTGHIVRICEQKDLKTDEERATKEINPGIYASSLSFLREALESLQPNNAQNEYYLTDIVAKHEGQPGQLHGHAVLSPCVHRRQALHDGRRPRG